jgi:hypothetical protein
MKTNAQQKKTKESKKTQQSSYQTMGALSCTFCEQFLHIQLFHVTHFHQKKF